MQVYIVELPGKWAEVYEDESEAQKRYEDWVKDKADNIDYGEIDWDCLEHLEILEHFKVPEATIEEIEEALGDTLNLYPDDYAPEGIKLIMEAINGLPLENRIAIVEQYLQTRDTPHIRQYNTIPKRQ